MYCFVLHIGIYVTSIVHIAKRHTSPALAFNMQTRPNILTDLVFACWKQAQDLCVSQYKYIPICNTKQCIYKTNYDLENREEIWLSPMTKAPTPTEMSKGQSDNTNNATKKFDYTAVADRLRTVSWSNYSHPTGVVNRFTGPPSH